MVARTPYRPNSSSSGAGCVLGMMVLFVLVVFLAAVGWDSINRITDDQAMPRFYELTGTRNVTIIRKSNDSLIGGDAHDVTYELLVNGKPKSARCTSAAFSDMICRVYDGGGE